MGTNSHIAIERENGAVESIRCQYDGYPAYNGALLLQHYNTPDRVNALIGLGNITYLAEELEPTGVHSFEESQEGVSPHQYEYIPPHTTDGPVLHHEQPGECRHAIQPRKNGH